MATYTVDDNDPRIVYAGGLWQVLRGSSQQYQATVHSTWDFNATATFPFNGTGVRVYATIPNGTGTSVVDYSLSRGSSLRVWQTSGSKPIYGKEVFYSGLLPLGNHTLVMSNMGEDNDMDLELDRIVVELQGSSSTGAQTSTLSASSSTQSAVIANSTSAPAGTLSGSSARSSSPSPVPKIVGSVIGALAFVCILFFVLFRVRQSKRKRVWSEKVNEIPTPFSPQQQKSPLPPSQPLTPYTPSGILSRTSELALGSNLTRSAAAFSQTPAPLITVSSMGPNPLPRIQPLPPSLPEKSPPDSPQPLAAAIPLHPTANSIAPSSFYQDPAIDDRPPSYQPDSR